MQTEMCIKYLHYQSEVWAQIHLLFFSVLERHLLCFYRNVGFIFNIFKKTIDFCDVHVISFQQPYSSLQCHIVPQKSF